MGKRKIQKLGKKHNHLELSMRHRCMRNQCLLRDTEVLAEKDLLRLSLYSWRIWWMKKDKKQRWPMSKPAFSSNW